MVFWALQLDSVHSSMTRVVFPGLIELAGSLTSGSAKISSDCHPRPKSICTRLIDQSPRLGQFYPLIAL